MINKEYTIIVEQRAITSAITNFFTHKNNKKPSKPFMQYKLPAYEEALATFEQTSDRLWDVVRNATRNIYPEFSDGTYTFAGFGSGEVCYIRLLRKFDALLVPMGSNDE